MRATSRRSRPRASRRLQEKGRTDTEIQKVLKPEWERQHEELVRRRSAYRFGGLSLLVSIGVFLAWMRWLRPAEGEWAGVPPGLVRVLAAARERPAPPVLHRPAASTAAAAPGPPGIDLSPLLSRRSAGDGDFDPAVVDTILQATGTRRDSILPVLQAIQARYRYLPDQALRRVCAESAITPAQVAGVASFYGQFRLTPAGAHIIRVCEGTACHVSGAVEVRNEIRRSLGMVNGCDTDPTGTFTVERVACIGSCSLAPVITVDDQIYGHLTALSVGGALKAFIDHATASGTNGHRRSRAHVHTLHPHLPPRPSLPVEIRIGSGTCGRAAGADAVHAALARSGRRVRGRSHGQGRGLQRALPS